MLLDDTADDLEQWNHTASLKHNDHQHVDYFKSSVMTHQHNIPALALQNQQEQQHFDDSAMESSRTEYNNTMDSAVESSRSSKRKTSTPLPYKQTTNKQQLATTNIALDETPVKPLYAESAEEFARNTSTPEGICIYFAQNNFLSCLVGTGPTLLGPTSRISIFDSYIW